MVNNLYYEEEETEEEDVWVNSISIGFKYDIAYDDTQILDSEGNIIDRYYLARYADDEGYYDEENGEFVYNYLTDENGEYIKYYELTHDDCISIGECKDSILELYEFVKKDFGEGIANGSIMLLMYPSEVTYMEDEVTPRQINAFLFNGFENDSFYSSTANIFKTSSDYFMTEEGVVKAEIGTVRVANGVEYTCVGINDGYICRIPFYALQDEFMLSSMTVFFDGKLTSSRIQEITDKIESLFGGKINGHVNTPEPYDPIEEQFNQMSYIISIGVMLIILLAISKFYSYILSNRKASLTVLRLCGSTRGKIHTIYMIEIFLTMIVTSVIGFLIFDLVLCEPIAELYPSFATFFTAKNEMIILGSYIILALIVMVITVIPVTKASVADMKRSG